MATTSLVRAQLHLSSSALALAKRLFSDLADRPDLTDARTLVDHACTFVSSAKDILDAHVRERGEPQPAKADYPLPDHRLAFRGDLLEDLEGGGAGDTLDMINNVQAALDRAKGIVDLLGNVDPGDGSSVLPGSMTPAARAAMHEIEDADLCLRAWWREQLRTRSPLVPPGVGISADTAR
jgi:hypothetical protein